MPKRVQLFQSHDFSGGLNYRDDAFEILENETPDCLNVRIMPRGGFQRRKTMSVLNTTNFSSQAARNIWSFLGNGVTQILVQDGNDAKFSTGTATFTAINPDALTVAAGSRMRAASMARLSTASSERCYIQRNAEQVAWKWDGTNATVLATSTGAYNDNLAAPAGGKMPKAKYICTHAGFMFHANTVETNAQTSRVRWSHPGEPEDYRTNDFIDVSPDDGDVITGIVSLGATLYVFKNRSVWAITGFDPTTFSLAKIADNIGAVSQEAITKSDSAVFFFDGYRGVFAIHPPPHSNYAPRVDWIFDRLAIKLTDHTIPPTALGSVVMGWLDSRVWLAVPWNSSTVPKRVFVFDPRVGKDGGAWYAYEYGAPSALTEIGPFLEWRPNAATTRFFVTGNDCKNVFELDAGTGTTDATDGSTTSSYPSYFRTGWYAAGIPGVKKRWRRPTYVVDADNDWTMQVSVFTDYEEIAPKSTNAVSVTASGAGGGVYWGVSNWASFNWGAAPDGDQSIKRASGFGSAYAVQLLFDGPQTLQWGVNALDFRFIPKRIK